MSEHYGAVYPAEFIRELFELLIEYGYLSRVHTTNESGKTIDNKGPSTFNKSKVSVTPFHLTNNLSTFFSEYEAAIDAKLLTRTKRGDTVNNMVLNIATWKIVTDKSVTLKNRKAKVACFHHKLSKYPIRLGMAETDYKSLGVQELIDLIS